MGLVAPLVARPEQKESAVAAYNESVRWVDRVFLLRYSERQRGEENDCCWWCSRDGEKVEVCVSYETEDGWLLRYRNPVLCPVCDGLLVLGQTEPGAVEARAGEAYLALSAALHVD
jgi:hypothetical protein